MTSPSRTPWASLALIAANLGLAYALLVDPAYANLYGFSATDPSLSTLLIAMFLHVNTLHLLGNMVFLAAVGPAVETAVGRLKFVALYLVGGAVGYAAHALVYAPSGVSTPLVGASANIAALIGYSIVRFTLVKVPLTSRVRVPVYGVVLLWVFLQAAGAFILIGGVGGTAYVAHLGGFLGGILIALVFRAPGQEALDAGRESIDRLSERTPAAALLAIERHLARHPGDRASMWQKVEVLETLGEIDEAKATLVQLLDEDADAIDTGRLMAELVRLDGIEALPTHRRVRIASTLTNSDPEMTRRLLTSVADGPDDPERPYALLALSELDPEEAPARLRELEQVYSLHPATETARARGLLP